MARTKRKSAGGENGKGKKPKHLQTALEVGQTVPDVTLVNEEAQEVKILELVKDTGALIFMYPKANTGGCTKQACGFRDNYTEIQEAGFEVFGMSFDKSKSQKNWKAKYDLPYHLLTDAEGELLAAFGALKADKKILRSHVVIAKGGKLLDVRNGISPGDSFTEAAKFCKEHPQKE